VHCEYFMSCSAQLISTDTEQILYFERILCNANISLCFQLTSTDTEQILYFERIQGKANTSCRVQLPVTSTDTDQIPVPVLYFEWIQCNDQLFYSNRPRCNTSTGTGILCSCSVYQYQYRYRTDILSGLFSYQYR
jgi:hypothetical protein